MTEHSLSVTLKAGTGYDSPWIVVYGDNPDEVQFKLQNISGVIEATVQAANLLKGANNAAPLLEGAPAEAAPAAPQQPAGWGNSAPQAQPQWSQPQQGAPAAPQVRLHPEGKTCACGQVLIFKEITSKKNNKTYQMWTCPSQQRKGDGHDSEFVN